MGPPSTVVSAKVAFGHLTIAVYVDQPLGPENPWRETKERERESPSVRGCFLDKSLENAGFLTRCLSGQS